MNKTDEKIMKILEIFHNEAISGEAARLMRNWLWIYVRLCILKKISIDDGDDIKNFGLKGEDLLSMIVPCPLEDSKDKTINALKHLLEETRERLKSGELQYSDSNLIVELPECSVNALTNELQKIDNVLPSIVNFTNKDYELLEETINNIMKTLSEIAKLLEDQPFEIKQSLVFGVMIAEVQNKKLVVSSSGELRFE